jgi:hypothetical protein
MSENTSPSIAAVRDLREASCGPIGAPTVTNDLSENVILCMPRMMRGLANNASKHYMAIRIISLPSSLSSKLLQHNVCTSTVH